MKKLTIVILLLIAVSGCDKLTYEKPFVIIDKMVDFPVDGETQYTFQDKKGLERSFTDLNNKYSIGDTIK